jgi:hypothetical protein
MRIHYYIFPTSDRPMCVAAPPKLLPAITEQSRLGELNVGGPTLYTIEKSTLYF